MPHQVEDYEPAATPSHVSDERNQFLLAQMMHHADADRYVSLRERIARGIRLQNRKRRGATVWRLEVHPDRLHPQPPLKFEQDISVRATYVEHSPHRKNIAFYCPDQRRNVAEELVCSKQVLVCVLNHFIRNIAAIENFRFV